MMCRHIDAWCPQRPASRVRSATVSRLVQACALLCLATEARVTEIAVPSQAHPSLLAAFKAAHPASAQDIVIMDGRHELGVPAPQIRHPTRLRAASSAVERGGFPGLEWKARLRGSWDLDGSPLSENGTFAHLSLENQRSPAKPDTSVCVMQVFGGKWDMSRCEIAGAGTGLDFDALVQLGDAVADRSREGGAGHIVVLPRINGRVMCAVNS